MTQHRSGKRADDVTWLCALYEQSTLARIIIIWDGWSWSKKFQWRLPTITIYCLGHISYTVSNLEHCAWGMLITEKSLVGEGKQNWKGIKTVLIRAWIRKTELFNLEMGRFRGTLITTFKWLKIIIWIRMKDYRASYDQTNHRGFD